MNIWNEAAGVLRCVHYPFPQIKNKLVEEMSAHDVRDSFRHQHDELLELAVLSDVAALHHLPEERGHEAQRRHHEAQGGRRQGSSCSTAHKAHAGGILIYIYPQSLKCVYYSS